MNELHTNEFITFNKNIDFILSCFNNFKYDDKNKDSNIIYNGCSTMLGASLGDSMGSYCEFTKASTNNQDYIWQEVNLIFDTAKGQLTDDSELAISLALGNLERIKKEQSNKDNFGVNSIANFYLFWFKSRPFDLGTTTRSAFKIRNKMNLDNHDFFAKEFSQNSLELNYKSKSNGFLMRHTPMSVLLYYMFKLDDSKIKLFNNNDDEKNNYSEIFNIIFNYIRDEINLTHSNDECVVAAVVYDFLILKILLTKDAYEKKKTTENVENSDNGDEFYKQCNMKEILDSLENFLEVVNKNNSGFKKEIKEIQTNLGQIRSFKNIPKQKSFFSFYSNSKKKDLLEEIDGPSIGYYMHAMNLIFYILEFFSDFITNSDEIYRNIINFICNKGGDTDTNCCIVGGVLGALLGSKNIESKYVNTHLKFNPCLMSNRWRPVIYSPIVLTLYGLKLYPTIKNLLIREEDNSGNENKKNTDISLDLLKNFVLTDIQTLYESRNPRNEEIEIINEFQENTLYEISKKL